MTAGLWGGNEPGGAHGQQGAQARERGAAVPAPPASERDLVRLPGPRRHLDRLERDLRSGRSCVWYFPDPMVDSGRAELFLRELYARFEEPIPVPGTVTALADRTGDRGSAVVIPTQRSTTPEPEAAFAGASNHFALWHDDDGFDAEDPYGALLGSLAAAPASPPPPSSHRGAAPGVAALASMSLGERLAKELGVTGDPLSELVRRADRLRNDVSGDDGLEDDALPSAPPLIVVRGWDEDSPEEMGRLLRTAHAVFRDEGLGAGHRPRFLIAARMGDLPSTAFGVGPSHDHVTLHWWWRVWTRLDSEVLLAWRPRPNAGAAEALLHRVTDAVVAEVCGPDIDSALALREAWKGGDLDSLRRALADILPSEAAVLDRTWPRRMSTAHASAPSAELRDAWSTGAVDSWDSHVRPVLSHHLLDPDSTELRTLVCHAQNRVLLPLVDEARTAFIDLVPGLLRKEINLDYFREQARSQYQVKKQLPAAPLVELEVADLQRASRLLTLTTEQQRRLDILCDARNFLSHLQPLAYRQLMAVAQALISDWVADDVE
ncbi:hypothetical protein C1I97_12490 [Streptomyces sp. NTH33]|uniref:hypothetical protein n=1 Tax=Streptomyces sp. NTH33 TaxID=1735453 RepID=UPI000DA9AB82|nr:hypothetical protein [Streptomyces sp. NTH33]PZH12190.1 hypothetical protein C1I97_12490 [Streptomyces sp. NTH33]